MNDYKEEILGLLRTTEKHGWPHVEEVLESFRHSLNAAKDSPRLDSVLGLFEGQRNELKRLENKLKMPARLVWQVAPMRGVRADEVLLARRDLIHAVSRLDFLLGQILDRPGYKKGGTPRTIEMLLSGTPEWNLVEEAYYLFIEFRGPFGDRDPVKQQDYPDLTDALYRQGTGQKPPFKIQDRCKKMVRYGRAVDGVARSPAAHKAASARHLMEDARQEMLLNAIEETADHKLAAHYREHSEKYAELCSQIEWPTPPWDRSSSTRGIVSNPTT